MLPSPLPYHRAIVQYLRISEPGLWNWFANSRQRATEVDAVRLELLKSTYRLDPTAKPKLYDLAESVRQQLQLSCSITLYQSQTGSALNAALAYLPTEAHIILSGPLDSVLTENEIRTVLGHELGHFKLLEEVEGEYLVASDLIRALAVDAGASQTASESSRLYNLWTEIYADRFACHVSDDVTDAIAALLKTSTGLAEVNAESYLRQAEEIFAKSDEKSDHFSHPEPYIRARALRLWSEKGDAAQPEIDRMIEGGLSFQRLDLLGQKRVSDLTKMFLQSLLGPVWFRSEPIIAHASRFFPDFTVDKEPIDLNPLKQELETGDASFRDYFCYLMLDFITVDRELGDPAIAAAILLGRQLGIDKRFAELVQKELGLGKKAFAKLDRYAESIIEKTNLVHQS